MIAEHKLKDKILSELEKSGSSISGISKLLNIDYYYVCYCVDDLIEKNLIDAQGATSMHTEGHEKLIDINHRGRFFLNQSGGYTKSHKQYNIKRIWNIVKITAAVINAIAILGVAIWATNQSSNSKTLDAKLSEKDSIIIYKKLLIEKLEEKQSP
jgi:hypothetical protein